MIGQRIGAALYALTHLAITFVGEASAAERGRACPVCGSAPPAPGPEGDPLGAAGSRFPDHGVRK